MHAHLDPFSSWTVIAAWAFVVWLVLSCLAAPVVGRAMAGERRIPAPRRPDHDDAPYDQEAVEALYADLAAFERGQR